MNKDYIIELETARRLYEAGVVKESLYTWDNLRREHFELHPALPNGKTVPADYVAYPALTLHELMEVMPSHVGDNFYLAVDKDYVKKTGKHIYRAAYHDVYERFLKEEEDENPLRALEALALYLLDHDLWPNTKEV